VVLNVSCRLTKNGAIHLSLELQLILKREDVPYVLRPTKGYEDLCEVAKEEMAKDEVRLSACPPPRLFTVACPLPDVSHSLRCDV
jgi:hypothetical protein